MLRRVKVPRPKSYQIMFSTDTRRLRTTVRTRRTTRGPPRARRSLLATTIGQTVLANFSALCRRLIRGRRLIPMASPSFRLLTIGQTRNFQTKTRFCYLPPLRLRHCANFARPVRPQPVQRIDVRLRIGAQRNSRSHTTSTTNGATLHRRITQRLCTRHYTRTGALTHQRLVFRLNNYIGNALPGSLISNGCFTRRQGFGLQLRTGGIGFSRCLGIQNRAIRRFHVRLRTRTRRGLQNDLNLLVITRQRRL